MFAKSKINRRGLSMLQKLVCTAVVSVLMTGIGLAQERKGKEGKGRAGTVGKITRFDFSKGILVVKVKNQDVASSNLFCTLTKDSSMQWGLGSALKVLTSKDEIKAKFKVGTTVRVVLEADRKTVNTIHGGWAATGHPTGKRQH
jgi:hypothetical protein